MHDLAASLRRLAQAIRTTAAALDELHIALEGAAPAGWDDYDAAGRPFGESACARSIWQAYGQATTVN
jgi:hypothetical protein